MIKETYLMKFLNRDNSQNDSKNGNEIIERSVGKSIERYDKA